MSGGYGLKATSKRGVRGHACDCIDTDLLNSQ